MLSATSPTSKTVPGTYEVLNIFVSFPPTSIPVQPGGPALITSNKPAAMLHQPQPRIYLAISLPTPQALSTVEENTTITLEIPLHIYGQVGPLSQEISLSTSWLASAPCPSQLVFQIFALCLEALFSPHIIGPPSGTGQVQGGRVRAPKCPTLCLCALSLLNSTFSFVPLLKGNAFTFTFIDISHSLSRAPKQYPISKDLQVLPLAG